MSLVSFHYLVFFVAVFMLNRALLDRPNARKNVLLVASYYFYACWDWRFTGLLAFATLVTFYSGMRIAAAGSAAERRLWLGFALFLGLGVLASFKYFNFFLDSVSLLLRAVGLNGGLSTLPLILPLGLSFFTFQSLSYALDVFHRRQAACRSLRDVALFVAFFPTVSSGPITRAHQLLPQLAQPVGALDARTGEGGALLLRGFIKKVAFADVLGAQLVNPAFARPLDFSSGYLLAGIYAYSFQVYMDLSGYTDMARGCALMLGFDLPENFDRPYRASSVSQFWQRWHMSMSSFFRDYLYFGLGGSRRGNVYLNLLLTFTAIGVWHGAGWNFVVYGLIHGGVVGAERWNRGRLRALGQPPANEGARAVIGAIVTFHIVAFSRILFRAPDIRSAAAYVRAMIAPARSVAPFNTLGVTVLVASALLHYLPSRIAWKPFERWLDAPVLVQGGCLVAIALGLLALSSGNAPFVYFRF